MNDFASDIARELQRYANVVEEELLESARRSCWMLL